MKVCVTTFACDRGKSGVGQYAIQMLRHLPRVAPDVEFDVLLFRDETEIYLAGATHMKAHYAPGLVRSPMANLLWHQVGLPWRALRARYDAVFIPAGNRRLPWRMPCPTVGTVHDLCALHVENKYGGLHMLYNLHVLPRLIRHLSCAITESESSKCDILQYARVPEDRIAVIPLAADAERYMPCDKAAAAARIAARYGIRMPYLLYISRIEHPGKNHVRLIHAFERLKAAARLPHQLVLVGSDWIRAEEVHRAAAASQFAGDVRFTGFVPAEDLPDFYCAADAFAFPSLYEGFGIPLLEAMLCGVPLACSNLSSMPEVAGDAAVLFDPCDEASIEQALREVLLDTALRARLVQRGLARSKTFSWEETARKTMAVVRRAAEGAFA